MAADMFLKIKTIDGESTDEKHKDWIEILSFNWGLSQPTSGSSSSGGARSAERANHSNFTIMKTMDKATPKLSLALCKGEHIPEVIVSLHRATGEKQKYMEYKMSDVMITSFQENGSDGGIPMECVSFDYAKIDMNYTVTDHKTGKPSGNVTANWDVTKNDGG
jgi:type VI secretion system secreted protein Hcp